MFIVWSWLTFTWVSCLWFQASHWSIWAPNLLKITTLLDNMYFGWEVKARSWLPHQMDWRLEESSDNCFFYPLWPVLMIAYQPLILIQLFSLLTCCRICWVFCTLSFVSDLQQMQCASLSCSIIVHTIMMNKPTILPWTLFSHLFLVFNLLTFPLLPHPYPYSVT